MRELASAAKVTKATLYAYFRSKNTLFHAVIAHWLEALPEPNLHSSVDRTLRARLDEIARQALRQARHPSSLAFAQMLARSTCVPQQYLEQWRQRFRIHRSHLENVFGEHACFADPGLAASQFLQLTVGNPDMEIVAVHDEARIAAALNLFGHACKAADKTADA